MNSEKAIQITGGLSRTSKMPGKSWGISAKKCKTGAKLAQIPGTVCYNCYALKGQYSYPNVYKAHEKRLNKWKRNKTWVGAMAFLINKDKCDVFRWFDSGDLQSEKMLLNIFEVCKQTPNKKHYLPTKEPQFVYPVVKNNSIPDNLVIRISAPNVDQIISAKHGAKTSMVFTEETPKGVFKCPAPKQGNECKSCRACWSSEVEVIGYHKH